MILIGALRLGGHYHISSQGSEWKEHHISILDVATFSPLVHEELSTGGAFPHMETRRATTKQVWDWKVLGCRGPAWWRPDQRKGSGTSRGKANDTEEAL